MAILINGTQWGWMEREDNWKYVNLSGDVSRSGNTVTLSNLKLYYELRYSTYRYGIVKTVKVNGTSTDITFNFNGTVTNTFDLNSTSFSVGATDTSATISFEDEDGAFNFSVGFPSGVSAPTGLNVTNLSTTKDTVKGVVSITDWGVGANNNRYLELNISKTKSTDSDKRRWQTNTKGSTVKAAVITCSSSSSGTMKIIPNTMYYVGAYATNGSADTGVKWDWGSVYTLAPKFTSVLCTAQEENNDGKVDATIKLTPDSSDGNALTETYKYRYKVATDSWSSWISLSGKPKTFTIQNLPGNRQVSIEAKITTSAGDSEVSSTSFTTIMAGERKFYVSANNVAKLAKKIYVGIPQFFSVDGASEGMSSKSHNLPAGFQELESITIVGNSSKELLLTDELDSNTKSLFIDIKPIQINASSSYNYVIKRTLAHQYGSSWGFEGNNYIDSQINALNERKKIYIKEITKRNNEFIVDGKIVRTSGTQDINSALRLAIETGNIVEIYSLIVCDNSHNVERYYIPAKNIATGKVGFVDLLNSHSKKVRKIYGSINGSAEIIYLDVD